MSPRALLSVYDKAGIVEFARGLADLGWQLVSSGGTSAALRAAGLDVLTVESVTGSPEMLSDRVKTLHPKIHGGLLADRDDPTHLADVERYGIELIDLVVSNLYPFSSDPSIQLIDIGGPAMVRAAAKNHAHVGVVTDPSDYDAVLSERRDQARPRPHRVRAHGGLRRRHRRVARRRSAAAADAPPVV
jgi:phosphoribosylaminoimidazolecarboxamide formyltransferase/IMP cyclohydrolase